MKFSNLIGIAIVIVVLIAGGSILLRPQTTEAPANDTVLVEDQDENAETNIIRNDNATDKQLEAELAADEAATSEIVTEEETGEDEALPVAVANVIMTDEGYSPTDLEVKVGTTVVFTNNGQAPRWPATDEHPVHTNYPGSDIKKCGTAEADSIFDACRGLLTGETYSFTFTVPGSWKYHDHLRASMRGTITVTE